MRAMIVAGARPNFMKVAPIIRALRRCGHEPYLVHTGQHYDARMSDAFFRDLGIPEPNAHLGVGSASHAQQTARIMQQFEPVLLQERPDWVIVVGDVNSTLACSLVAAKLRLETKSRIAHVEAGLRSRDWNMPEEINRVLTDQLSDLLLTPSHDARENLIGEGLGEQRIVFVGNVMIDTLREQLPAARELNVPGELKLKKNGYVIATLHRPSNVDSADALRIILEGLRAVAEEMPVMMPLHPRTEATAKKFGLGELLSSIRIMEPQGYRSMLGLLDGAALALTDSGGIQEETTVLGVPCVTLREQTERPVTVSEGTNRLAPWPLTVAGIRTAARNALSTGRVEAFSKAPDGWDGKAAERIVNALARAWVSEPPT
ncbi:MAG: UDP-N-acetylglucosamine 2-epimerase (non-hydrolyzing) [Gemmatimonadaceae bacterium]